MQEKMKIPLGHGCKLIFASLFVFIILPYLLLQHTKIKVESHQLQTLFAQNVTIPQAVSPLPNSKKGTTSLVRPVNSLLSSKVKPMTQERNGYLVGNVSALSFMSYGQEVDLRIIVLAYDRAVSLGKCLNSLNTVDFNGASIMLHIWIDRNNETNLVHDDTYNVAHAFRFAHGNKTVHVHPYHVGILNQWVNAWRPGENTQEIALIIEDDMTVSRHIWHWLKSGHKAYGGRSDISGFGLSHPGMEHVHATYLDIPAKFTVYLYKVICTWGFSPHPKSWRQFQEWFYRSELNSTFQPLVEGILPTQWFKGERSKGRERNLWEMWHIYYTHNSHPQQYTVMLNTAQEGLLAVNRHEVGLHDRGRAKTEILCETWKNSFQDFPENPPKFGYDGKLENSFEVNISDFNTRDHVPDQ